MAEFIEVTKKDAKVQNEISQTIEKYNRESYLAKSTLRQNAFNTK